MAKFQRNRNNRNRGFTGEIPSQPILHRLRSVKHRRRSRQLPLRLRPSSTGSRPSDCAPNHPLQMPQSAPSRSLGFASTATTRRSRPQKAAISPLHSPQLHRFDQCGHWKHRVSCRRVGFKHEAIFRKIRFRYNVRFEDGT